MKVTRITKSLLAGRRRRRKARRTEAREQATPAPQRGTTTVVRLEPPNVWPFPKAGWHRRQA